MRLPWHQRGMAQGQDTSQRWIRRIKCLGAQVSGRAAEESRGQRQDLPVVTCTCLAQALFQFPNRRTRIALVGHLYTLGDDLRKVDIGKIST